jgi:O-antigen ligase
MWYPNKARSWQDKFHLPRLNFYDFLQQNIRWMKWVIVLVVFLVTIGIGFLASNFEPVYVAAGAWGLLVGLVGLMFIRNFDVFPIFILGVAIFVPVTLPTGTGSRLAISMVVEVLLLGLWVLKSMTVDRRFSIKPSPINLPLAGFFGSVILSVLWSILFRDPFVFVPDTFIIVQIASAIVMILLPVAMLMVGNFIETTKPLVILAVMMLVAGALGLVKYLLNLPLPVDTRGLFSLWVIGLAVGLAIFIRNMHWGVRLLLLLLAGGWIYWSFILNIYWLAGWLPPMVAIGILSWMRSKKMSLVFLVFLVTIIIINKDYYLGKVLQNETQESGYTRLAAWEANWRITRDHLLFGTGPAGYAVYYMTYFPTDAMATHSNYIDTLAQTGILGTIFFIWMFGTLGWMGLKLCHRLKGRGDFVEAMANVSFAGTGACIIIMAFGDWLFPFAYTQTIVGFNYAVYNWIFMGVILTLDRLFPAQKSV